MFDIGLELMNGEQKVAKCSKFDGGGREEKKKKSSGFFQQNLTFIGVF